MRLFIAIDFNELKGYFAELQAFLPNAKLLSLAKSFHITLKFLGEVQPHISDKLVESLKKVEFQPFEAHLDFIGTFPTENYIRVIWVGLRPEDKIFVLQEKIDESLKDLFKKEKDFKAHITLARVKYLENKKQFLEQLRKIKIENKKTEVKDFKLIKSTLTPKGPIYEDLAVFKSAGYNL